MLTLVLALVSSASAASSTEISVGRVVAVRDGTVTVLEERSGRTVSEDLLSLDAASLAPGQVVLVYHEAAGTLVVAAG